MSSSSPRLGRFAPAPVTTGPAQNKNAKNAPFGKSSSPVQPSPRDSYASTDLATPEAPESPSSAVFRPPSSAASAPLQQPLTASIMSYFTGRPRAASAPAAPAGAQALTHEQAHAELLALGPSMAQIPVSTLIPIIDALDFGKLPKNPGALFVGFMHIDTLPPRQQLRILADANLSAEISGPQKLAMLRKYTKTDATLRQLPDMHIDVSDAELLKGYQAQLETFKNNARSFDADTNGARIHYVNNGETLHDVGIAIEHMCAGDTAWSGEVKRLANQTMANAFWLNMTDPKGVGILPFDGIKPADAANRPTLTITHDSLRDVIQLTLEVRQNNPNAIKLGDTMFDTSESANSLQYKTIVEVPKGAPIRAAYASLHLDLSPSLWERD